MKLRSESISENLRKFYFKKGWTHSEVRQYLSDHFSVKVSLRTLKYWKKNLKDPEWQHPTIPEPPFRKKMTEQDEKKIVSLRKHTGWSGKKIRAVHNIDLCENTIKKTIRKHGLSRGSKIENRRIHWVKWQRPYPNTLWQVDSRKTEDESGWVIEAIDDCSRFCPGIYPTKNLTTRKLTFFLERIMKIHGKPYELLTDNGSENGGVSDNSQFDKWCEIQGIKHRRSKPHKPTTLGKVERFHQTVQNELPYCNNDLELFRYRYNHIRPHESLRMKTPAEVHFSLRIKIEGMHLRDKW